jgi:hypothetical protein
MLSNNEEAKKKKACVSGQTDARNKNKISISVKKTKFKNKHSN